MDFGMDGFGSMDGFDALDAIAGAAQSVLPLAVGTGVSFGVSEAIMFLVDNTTVRKWRWAIGFVGSLLLGLAMWKWRSPEDGALTIGSGLFTSAVCWGNEQLLVYKAKKAAGVAGLGRYVVQPAEPLLAGLGRYVVEPAEPLLAGLGQMDRGEYNVAVGAVNPGIFG